MTSVFTGNNQNTPTSRMTPSLFSALEQSQQIKVIRIDSNNKIKTAVTIHQNNCQGLQGKLSEAEVDIFSRYTSQQSESKSLPGTLERCDQVCSPPENYNSLFTSTEY